MAVTFRPRRSILVCGLLLAAFFLLITAGYATLLFIDNAKAVNQGFKDGPHAAALGYFGIAVFGSMFVMSFLMCVSYFVERITVDSTTIIIRSLTQNKRFDISSIQELVWNHRSNGGKLVLRFHDFESSRSLVWILTGRSTSYCASYPKLDPSSYADRME